MWSLNYLHLSLTQIGLLQLRHLQSRKLFRRSKLVHYRFIFLRIARLLLKYLSLTQGYLYLLLVSLLGLLT